MKRNFFIQLHITAKCLNRCRHCYQSGYEGRDLPARLFVQFIEETINHFSPHYGMPELNITGGDPLLYESFWDLAGFISRSGCPWNLLSSGTNISKEVGLRLKDHGVGSVQISLEGIGQANDRIRGPGHFGQALKALDALEDAGVQSSVAMTVSGSNFQEVQKMMDFTTARGLFLGLHRWIPVGPHRSDMEQLDRGLWQDLALKVAELSLGGAKIRMNDPLFFLAVAQLQHRQEHLQKNGALLGCTAGVAGVTVMEDGTVFPCRKLPIPLGNVLATPLLRIWLDSPVLWKLRDRSLFPGECGVCENRTLCGGCRASAYASGGGVYGMDPYCGA